ncbi:MAG: hypothetical protein WC683_01100 [bacterium]
MRCLRCGHCCQRYLVAIVVDPALGVVPENIVAIDPPRDGPCPHLRGDRPGAYACAVHDEPWYPETPCFAHGQIERSADEPCRIGSALLGGAP